MVVGGVFKGGSVCFFNDKFCVLWERSLMRRMRSKRRTNENFEDF